MSVPAWTTALVTSSLTHSSAVSTRSRSNERPGEASRTARRASATLDGCGRSCRFSRERSRLGSVTRRFYPNRHVRHTAFGASSLPQEKESSTGTGDRRDLGRLPPWQREGIAATCNLRGAWCVFRSEKHGNPGGEHSCQEDRRSRRRDRRPCGRRLGRRFGEPPPSALEDARPSAAEPADPTAARRRALVPTAAPTPRPPSRRSHPRLRTPPVPRRRPGPLRPAAPATRARGARAAGPAPPDLVVLRRRHRLLRRHHAPAVKGFQAKRGFPASGIVDPYPSGWTR